MGLFKRLREAKAQLHPGPYSVDVTENIGTTGRGVTNGMRYRVVVTAADGYPVKVDYSLTYRTAYIIGRKYADKLEAAAPEAA